MDKKASIHVVFWVKDGVLYWRTDDSYSNSTPLRGRDPEKTAKEIVVFFEKYRAESVSYELI